VLREGKPFHVPPASRLGERTAAGQSTARRRRDVKAILALAPDDGATTWQALPTRSPSHRGRARKEAHLSHMTAAPHDALLVVAADKLHNATCTLADVRAEGAIA